MTAEVAYRWEESFDTSCDCPRYTMCYRPTSWDNPHLCVHESWNFPLDLLQPKPLGNRWWDNLAASSTVGIFYCLVIFVFIYLLQCLNRRHSMMRLTASMVECLRRQITVPAFPATTAADFPAPIVAAEAGQSRFDRDGFESIALNVPDDSSTVKAGQSSKSARTAAPKAAPRTRTLEEVTSV